MPACTNQVLQPVKLPEKAGQIPAWSASSECPGADWSSVGTQAWSAQALQRRWCDRAGCCALRPERWLSSKAAGVGLSTHWCRPRGAAAMPGAVKLLLSCSRKCRSLVFWALYVNPNTEVALLSTSALLGPVSLL